MLDDAISFHPLAEIFPLIEGAEFDDLVADIAEHGLHEPIVVLDEHILDGRNRYRACLAAAVDPVFTPFRGDDPLAFVISANLRRRHLSESQRAMVAAKLATLQDGQRADLVEGTPIGVAAELLNISERAIVRARAVQDHGAPELVRAVERGEVSVSAAADVATRPVEQQREIVARGEKEILEAAKQIRAERAEARRGVRLQHIEQIARGNTPLPTDKKYPVIYCDPPWYFEPYGSDNYDRAPGYPTMTLDEICALPVCDLATDPAILFLWTTASHLEQAFKVINAWSFKFSTSAVWIKTDCAPGLGHFVRHQHEILLIARRGEFPSPSPNVRPSSVISAPRREHSRKPDEVYEIIERMYPSLLRIELFARGRRPGWDAWGNQANTDGTEAA
jgi:N6-adenosine-specific RNA methylase IME4